MLDKHLILWPMAALAALTFFVLTVMPFVRVVAVRSGKARVSDFKLGESERVPERARIINRNYMNLLELPLLFYVACLIAFADNRVNALTLGLAWVFVGLRYAHSLVHLTINKVLLRLALFASAATVLLGLWAAIFWQIAGH
ncbi:MAPEG family protein [Asticcacaulis solisilvae]|uniref:MAPEG family protein n=1 Tax=Asticcacaulis solisilvae TaxID=1217274 RepID=UPI003FD724AB